VVVSTSKVVVGVDGSEPSRAALKWAAGYAARRQVELVVVNAYDWRVAGARMQVGGGYAAAVRQVADGVVATAAQEARDAFPSLAVTAHVATGAAAPTLLDCAGDGSLLVVGSRGRGGFASLVLGSVGQQVATHASGPVVVVRGRGDTGHGPVVVGLDGSPASAHTLGVAVAEAAMREAKLSVVTVCAEATPPWGRDVAPHVDEAGQLTLQHARARLAEEIAPWLVEFPGVTVDASAVGGHPVEVLTDLSRRAQLVVVGTGGHGGFAGLLLGAVGLQLIHHADCPVLIVRTPTLP
jgi:nucleotide-binding universal stress UspA family protein